MNCEDCGHEVQPYALEVGGGFGNRVCLGCSLLRRMGKHQSEMAMAARDMSQQRLYRLAAAGFMPARRELVRRVLAPHDLELN